jgi:hypothetical protein
MLLVVTHAGGAGEATRAKAIDYSRYVGPIEQFEQFDGVPTRL